MASGENDTAVSFQFHQNINTIFLLPRLGQPVYLYAQAFGRRFSTVAKRTIRTAPWRIREKIKALEKKINNFYWFL